MSFIHVIAFVISWTPYTVMATWYEKLSKIFKLKKFHQISLIYFHDKLNNSFRDTIDEESAKNVSLEVVPDITGKLS